MSDVMRQRLRNTVEQRDNINKSKLLKDSKQQLRKIIETKMKTTMIGALAKFEAFFGKQWGHGLDEKDCDEKQLAWYNVWQQCRDEILNNGNAQLRGILAELDLYSIKWEGYKAEFSKPNLNRS